MENLVEHAAGVHEEAAIGVGGDEVVGKEGVAGEVEGFEDEAVQLLEVASSRAELEEGRVVVRKTRRTHEERRKKSRLYI